MTVENTSKGFNPIRTFTQLFFRKQFAPHRLVGLSYLIQYVLSLYLYLTDYQSYKRSFLAWSLPATGVLQSIVAALTFTFLPKKKIDSGYFSTTEQGASVMSYPFLVENSFFAGLLLFQQLYYHDDIYPFLTGTIVIENLVVFLPYVVRPLWPKTHFRDALNNEKNKKSPHRTFFFYATWVTKVFYVWAKHFMGFFLNYVRFMNRVTEEQQKAMYLLFILSGFAVTISMFLHTLKFKGYIDARTSFLIYAASYMSTFYAFLQMMDIFAMNWDLVAVTMIGLVLNFVSPHVQSAYQILLLVVFNLVRHGVIQY